MPFFPFEICACILPGMNCIFEVRAKPGEKFGRERDKLAHALCEEFNLEDSRLEWDERGFHTKLPEADAARAGHSLQLHGLGTAYDWKATRILPQDDKAEAEIMAKLYCAGDTTGRPEKRKDRDEPIPMSHKRESKKVIRAAKKAAKVPVVVRKDD